MTGVFEGFATIVVVILLGFLLAHFGVLDEYGRRGAMQLIYGWDHPWDKGELQELLAWRNRANA